MKKKAHKIEAENELTPRQRKFCEEYIYDWNATRSYLVAYPNIKDTDTAGAAASRLLGNVKVQSYLESIQRDLEKIAGISRLKVLQEHQKLAFSSIAHLHNTWIRRKEFEELTDDQKACIAEIDTKVRTEYAYDSDTEKKEPVSVEYVRIKLFDKQKALESISKMLGYDAPGKLALTDTEGKSVPLIVFKDFKNEQQA